MVFDKKIFAKKIFKECVYVLLAGIAAVYGDNSYYLALLPLFKGLENYMKHK